MASRASVGQWGEAIAAKWLGEQGFAVLARNWRAGRGELDIVAERGGVIHIVEVRARRGAAHGTPEESVTSRKRLKLLETAQAWLLAHNREDATWQADLIVIELDARNAVTRLEWLPEAISG